MFHLLIAEDDANLRGLFSDLLIDNGYQVTEAANGLEALAAFDGKHIDLLVCDIMMPDMDGFELTGDLREAGYSLPIIMVTAKEALDDKRQGFGLGADDYMVKPVNFEELLLRIEALLRRSRIASEHRLAVGQVALDYDKLSVQTPKEETVLPKKEFQLLFKLLSSIGKTFTRRQLMDEIWGMDSDADERTVDVHIKRLREKFGGLTDFSIVTVRGLGYRAKRGE